MVQKVRITSPHVAEAEPGRREPLQRFVDILRARLPDWNEEMRWGMAAWTKGDFHFAVANQKGYLALYGCGPVLDAHRAELKGADCGKGCVRFKKPDQIDFGMVDRLVAAAVAAKA